MAKWPARETTEIGAERVPATGQWRFVIFGVQRKVVHAGEPVHDTAEDARAEGREWLAQTLLR